MDTKALWATTGHSSALWEATTSVLWEEATTLDPEGQALGPLKEDSTRTISEATGTTKWDATTRATEEIEQELSLPCKP